MANSTFQQGDGKNMKIKISSPCRKILQNYSGLLNISETELINRMIFSFAKADIDLLSCLLMQPGDLIE
ncbi:hypothetical protein EDF78_11914 [Rahnella sp. BIGb0236]|uniref:hypothetical protein n=1 Tax=Rahnella sp. BIGb0236 TaxID=2485117 RepID=UPI00105FAF2C|nr:hypothetical protein [Rahnella sp. BIGb0236]TDS84865.1 hypothetical protein EDF78_11914 [Rahnella sp. BIGb0236]